MGTKTEPSTSPTSFPHHPRSHLHKPWRSRKGNQGICSFLSRSPESRRPSEICISEFILSLRAHGLLCGQLWHQSCLRVPSRTTRHNSCNCLAVDRSTHLRRSLCHHRHPQHLSKPPFCSGLMGTSAQLRKLSWDTIKAICVKHLAWCLAQVSRVNNH